MCNSRRDLLDAIARASPMGKGRSMRPFPINERGQRFRLIQSGGTTWAGTALTGFHPFPSETVRWTVSDGTAWHCCLRSLDANALPRSKCSANARRFPTHALSVTYVKPPADGCSPSGRAKTGSMSPPFTPSVTAKAVPPPSEREAQCPVGLDTDALPRSKCSANARRFPARAL